MTTAKKQGSGGAESFLQTGVAWWDRKYPRQIAVFTTNRPGSWMELGQFLIDGTACPFDLGDSASGPRRRMLESQAWG